MVTRVHGAYIFLKKGDIVLHWRKLGILSLAAKHNVFSAKKGKKISNDAKAKFKYVPLMDGLSGKKRGKVRPHGSSIFYRLKDLLIAMSAMPIAAGSPGDFVVTNEMDFNGFIKSTFDGEKHLKDKEERNLWSPVFNSAVCNGYGCHCEINEEAYTSTRELLLWNLEMRENLQYSKVRPVVEVSWRLLPLALHIKMGYCNKLKLPKGDGNYLLTWRNCRPRTQSLFLVCRGLDRSSAGFLEGVSESAWLCVPC